MCGEYTDLLISIRCKALFSIVTVKLDLVIRPTVAVMHYPVSPTARQRCEGFFKFQSQGALALSRGD